MGTPGGSTTASGSGRRGCTCSRSPGSGCATHVSEVPDLVLDRMLWNKVYRRSFWTEYGYTFPPIRYEDYPVALKAHLDAVTVDTITQPVYYWRERESGSRSPSRSSSSATSATGSSRPGW